MQRQKQLNQQAQLQMGDLGGLHHEKMRSSLEIQAQSIQMHRQIRQVLQIEQGKRNVEKTRLSHGTMETSFLLARSGSQKCCPACADYIRRELLFRRGDDFL